MTTEEIKTLKMVVSGNTYKAREKLKSEGFRWNAEDKQWECDVVPSRNKITGDEGYADLSGAYKGPIESIAHTVKCYAKSKDITVTVE